MYLGKINKGKLKGTEIYIKKHSRNCGRYWGFGYLLGDGFFHFSSLLCFHLDEGIQYLNPFENITDDDYYVLADMFSAAYKMKEMAQVYRRGGGYTDRAPRDYIDEGKEKELNETLKKLLDQIRDKVKEIDKKRK